MNDCICSICKVQEYKIYYNIKIKDQQNRTKEKHNKFWFLRREEKFYMPLSDTNKSFLFHPCIIDNWKSKVMHRE